MADRSDRLGELKIERNPETVRGLPWRLLSIVLVGGAAAAAAWLLFRLNGDAVAVETEIARRPPSQAAARSVLDASGYVTARREATVSSEVTGKVVEILVEEGMRVEKDQVVAKLDDTTQRARYDLSVAQLGAARAALLETEAQLRAARLERDRLRELVNRNLTSISSVDAAEAGYDALAARLGTGRENVKVAERGVAVAADALEDMTIRAPFGGMVVSKNAQPGEMISPISAGGGFTRTGICTIVDMESLEIEVDVNEAYIQRVTAGQRVSATLDAYPDWRIPAEVIAIVPTADRQKATVRVRIGFLETDRRILRDMGAKVAFLDAEAPAETGDRASGVMISGDALHSDENGNFVWRVSNDTVERRPVTVSGTSDRDRVLILDGLSPGDTIVRSAATPLSPGQTVSMKESS